MKSLVIVQPYVPSYRAQFFRKLEEQLLAVGVQLTIVSGRPPRKQALRSDAVALSCQIEVDTNHIRFKNRSINLGGTTPRWKTADGVILGLEGSSIDLYRAIGRRRFSNLKVGVWGHVKSYVNAGNVVDMALERWQMKNVDHVFAYTEGGSAYAAATGISQDRITALMNSVDTGSLEREKAQLLQDPSLSAEFRRTYDLEPNKTLAYMGGLDESKRIGFLAQALDRFWDLSPSVKILIAGKGSDSELLSRAVERGQVVMLGYADDRVKAQLGLAASAFLMPGRVGLVAVESILLGRPLLTTSWPFHSAEIEYLSEGVTMYTSKDDPLAYAGLMHQVVTERGSRKSLDGSEWEYPTLDGMVGRYTAGVKTMMEID